MGNLLNPIVLNQNYKFNDNICLKYNDWKYPTITFNNNYLFIKNNKDELNDSLFYYDGFKYKLIEIIYKDTEYKIDNKKYFKEFNFIHQKFNEFCPYDYIVVVLLLNKKKNNNEYSIWNKLCDLEGLPSNIYDNKTYWFGTEKNPIQMKLNYFIKFLNYNKLIKYSYSKKYFKDFKCYNVKYIIIETNLTN